MSLISNSLNDALVVLQAFIADEKNESAINNVAESMADCLKSGGKIIACGNGGSLCDASHFVEELTGRFRDNRKSLAAVAINDASHITCVGNDYGFDYIFSKYIEGVGVSGDVLLVISTSGNSENIIKAIEKAKAKGMKVIALTGKDGGKAGAMAHLEIRVPWFEYSDRIQEIHIKILHILVELIEQLVKKN